MLCGGNQMRVSTLIKNVFSDMTPIVKIVTKEELERKIKTRTVLIDPEVIAKLFVFFAGRGNIEGVALLRGKICGEYLVIKDAYCCHDSRASSVDARVDAKCFVEASQVNDGDYICGLAHSHVGGVPVFMSSTDEKIQKDLQVLFSDCVGLVMNPFAKDGIDFKFYRLDPEDDSVKKIEYGYLGGKK